MEIERKFLVTHSPDLSRIEPNRYERYYLSVTKNSEERIQGVNGVYAYEKKVAIDAFTRSTERHELVREEFEELKADSSRAIIRDSFKISSQLSIKVYYGEFEGLIRAEVEFESLAEANAYIPESWMGAEITDSPLGRDSRLLQLDHGEFLRILG